MTVPTWQRVTVAVVGFALTVALSGTVGYLLAGIMP